MKKILGLIWCGLLMVSVFCRYASAQLFIEEGKIKKTVIPGQAIADSVTVHNSTDQPIEVAVYLEDFEYVAPFDGQKKFYPAGTLTRSAAQWINFEPRQFSVAPYTKQKINFTVNVPVDASGGYYSVLFFERQDVQQIDGPVGLQVISRVGSLLFFETNDSKKEIQLLDLTFDKADLKGKVINTGDIHLIAQCFYYVINKEGVPVDRGELNPLYLSEKNQSDIVIHLGQGLSPGPYTAVLTFDLEDGVSFVEEINFVVDPSGMFQKS